MLHIVAVLIALLNAVGSVISVTNGQHVDGALLAVNAAMFVVMANMK